LENKNTRTLPIIHELKCNARFYEHLRLKTKTFEVRKFDRDYRINDILLIRPYDKISKLCAKGLEDGWVLPTVSNPFPEDNFSYGWGYMTASIMYILTHEDFADGIKEGYCVLGLKDLG